MCFDQICAQLCHHVAGWFSKFHVLSAVAWGVLSTRAQIFIDWTYSVLNLTFISMFEPVRCPRTLPLRFFVKIDLFVSGVSYRSSQGRCMLSGRNQGVVSCGIVLGFGTRRSLTSLAAPHKVLKNSLLPVFNIAGLQQRLWVLAWYIRCALWACMPLWLLSFGSIRTAVLEITFYGPPP